MRYFQKLLCLLILVLAASFGVGGCVLLYSDFSVQRSRMAAANAAAHAQACTLLQTEILDLQRRGISTGDAALTARVTEQGVPAALWRGDTLVCATLEGLQSLPLGDAATVTVRTENSIYAVYASDLQGGLRFVTAYDLTGLYRDRNAALMRFLLLEAAVLAAASAVTALLARRLTRPLAVLTDAGAQIAAGDYARRTDLHTGDPIYHKCRSGDAEDVRWMEASASMPLAAKAVRIGHYSLLDGGVADSIPVRFFESLGYKRNLIILTQPKGFVKKKNPMLPAIRARYLRYPAFVEAVADRHERYNETLSYISMLEQSGKDYVIRPPIPLEIGAMERDPAQLRRVYETGRAVAENQIDKIEAFLNDVKETPEE